MNNIRPSIKGGWYPKDPYLLSQSIEKYIKNAQTNSTYEKIKGIIVPHAGHKYSGQVAAYGFKCIRDLNPDTVVIISPSHFTPGADLVITSHDFYETPLGKIKIDKELVNSIVQKLKSGYDVTYKRITNDPEHSIEVELPFLQQIYGEFKLIPIMIRNHNDKVSQALGHILTELLSDRNSILIASSDLSHYYDQKIANKLDKEIIHRIESFDPQSVLDAEQQGVGQACGIGAIATVLWACKEQGAKKVDILNYATSGDISGDYDGVVGYVSALIS